MDKALELFIAFQTRMLMGRDERGQGTLEYVGMIIVAAILAVAILEAATEVDLKSVFTEQVKKITDKG